jgi:hypothetical protein
MKRPGLTSLYVPKSEESVRDSLSDREDDGTALMDALAPNARQKGRMARSV